MADLFEMINKYSEIVIFGKSIKGEIIYRLIRDKTSKTRIIFCDNDLHKQDGIQVISVSEAALKYGKALYVVPSAFYLAEKKDQLLKLGISEDQIIQSTSKEISIEEGREKRLHPLTEETFRFEFCIVKHCNLNCRSCDHFSPLIDNEFMDIAQFKKDIERLAVLFHNKAEQILILGGEPLLNPDIDVYMSGSRGAFPNSNIYIVTNGLLLKKMKDSFWENCRKYNIGIRVTQYPIGIKYDILRILADNNKVDFDFFGITKLGERKMWHHPFDLQGEQDITENFILCYSGNRCITLENGKLYTCPIPLTSRAFSRYYNIDLDVSKDDYIDIYEVKSSKEILKKLARPIPFCRYCDVKNRKYDCPWGKSKKDIKEWTL